MDVIRYYRSRGARPFVRAYSAFSSLLLALVVFSDASTQGRFPIGEAVGLGATALCLAIYGEIVMSRIGLIETAEAFIDRGGSLARPRTITKSEVLRFEAINRGWFVGVAAVMKSGARIGLRGVSQGRLTRPRGRVVCWEGGSTNDVVAELNSRL